MTKVEEVLQKRYLKLATAYFYKIAAIYNLVTAPAAIVFKTKLSSPIKKARIL